MIVLVPALCPQTEVARVAIDHPVYPIGKLKQLDSGAKLEWVAWLEDLDGNRAAEARAISGEPAAP